MNREDVNLKERARRSLLSRGDDVTVLIQSTEMPATRGRCAPTQCRWVPLGSREGREQTGWESVGGNRVQDPSEHIEKQGSRPGDREELVMRISPGT